MTRSQYIRVAITEHMAKTSDLPTASTLEDISQIQSKPRRPIPQGLIKKYPWIVDSNDTEYIEFLIDLEEGKIDLHVEDKN